MRGVKWVVGVAGAAGLAVGAVLAAPTGASAANGQGLVMGQRNESTAWTVYRNPSFLRGLTSAPYNWSERDFEGKMPGFQVEGGALLDYTFGYVASINHVSSLETSADEATFGKATAYSANVTTLTLKPLPGAHPKSGNRGDLVTDKDGKLWFCKGGTSWKQIA